MKKLIPLFLIAFLLSIVSCSTGSSDLERNGLKGRVKAVREYRCDVTYENDKWVPSSDCQNDVSVVEYSEDGVYRCSLTLNNCGDTASMTTVRYEGGELVEENYFTRVNLTPIHSKLMQVSRTVMERVSDKQMNFEVWQDDVLRFEGSTYFDKKGRVEKQIQFINNRQVMVHNVYEKGLLVEMYQEELDGSRSATQLFEYDDFDEQGNWTTRLVYFEDAKISPELAITREIEYY